MKQSRSTRLMFLGAGLGILVAITLIFVVQNNRSTGQPAIGDEGIASKADGQEAPELNLPVDQALPLDQSVAAPAPALPESNVPDSLVAQTRQAIASTQSNKSTEPAVPVKVMPAFDVAEARAKAEQLEKEQGIYRFAESLPLDITPSRDGAWQDMGDGIVKWSMDIQSPGADSLNLAFSQFRLPPGAKLDIFPAEGEGQRYSFSAKDNDDHGQLWTPLIEGDHARIELDIPAVLRTHMRLQLASVQHAFRNWAKDNGLDGKIGGSRSGSCNIDVVCSAADLAFGSLIDAHRDQIQSVGAYTLGGRDTCTGALINNTRQDRTPYFLTADHCGVRTDTAPSMVVYWNFQNSTCRQPNSGTSGGVGNGPLNMFNTGAIFRAGSAASDFTLVELDDPVDPEANPYFAGWDRSGTQVTMATGIHHPAVAEKRISFEYDTLQVTSYLGNIPPGDGSEWRVSDWDEGTTEGGSSGSPLFDQNRRIVGQLHGGFAACGNDSADWYGRLFTSWSGGGTPSTRLSDWLDPLGFGNTTLDGLSNDEMLSVEPLAMLEGDAGETNNFAFVVSLSEATTQTILVDVMTRDGSALSGEDYITLPQTMLTFLPNETSKVVTVDVLGDFTPEEHESFFVVLTNAINATVDALGDGEGMILNDDYIPPFITSTNVVSGSVQSLLRYAITATNTPTGYAITNEPAGMMIDEFSGELTWLPDMLGAYTVDLIATNPAGSDTITLTIDVGVNPLADAVDAEGISVFSNPVEWFRQTAVTFDGVDAARSGAIGDGESTVMTVEVSGPDQLGFAWRVSSEPGYDFLRVSVDGVLQAEISGEQGWASQFVDIPEGNHTVTWEYIKDGSLSDGLDAGFVDDVFLATAANFPVISSPVQVLGFEGVPFEYELLTVNPIDTSLAAGLQSGWIYDDGEELLSHDSPVPGDYTMAFVLSEGVRSRTYLLNVRIVESIPLNEALDVDMSLFFGGDDSGTNWVFQTTDSNDGEDAAASPIGVRHNSSHEFTTQVMGPGTVSFFWKVSSQTNADTLVFYRAGEVVAAISGEERWAEVVTFLEPGLQELRWAYEKDEVGNVGLDRGWVDQLSYGGYAAWLLENGYVINGALFDADADDDGWPNLLEYALSEDPNAFTDGGIEPPFLDAGTITMEFDKVDDPGLQYRVESSLSPEGPWSEDFIQSVVDDATTYRVTVDNAIGEAGFLRLQVNWVTP